LLTSSTLSPTGAGLLGVTIKLDDYGGADERMVRVLEVEEHSPAAGTSTPDCFSDSLIV
jgi:hypothetical protein